MSTLTNGIATQSDIIDYFAFHNDLYYDIDDGTRCDHNDKINYTRSIDNLIRSRFFDDKYITHLENSDELFTSFGNNFSSFSTNYSVNTDMIRDITPKDSDNMFLPGEYIDYNKLVKYEDIGIRTNFDIGINYCGTTALNAGGNVYTNLASWLKDYGDSNRMFSLYLCIHLNVTSVAGISTTATYNMDNADIIIPIPKSSIRKAILSSALKSSLFADGLLKCTYPETEWEEYVGMDSARDEGLSNIMGTLSLNSIYKLFNYFGNATNDIAKRKILGCLIMVSYGPSVSVDFMSNGTKVVINDIMNTTLRKTKTIKLSSKLADHPKAGSSVSGYMWPFGSSTTADLEYSGTASNNLLVNNNFGYTSSTNLYKILKKGVIDRIESGQAPYFKIELGRPNVCSGTTNTMSGSTTITAGESTNYSASVVEIKYFMGGAVNRRGTSRDLTNQLSWSSSNNAVATVSGGTVTGISAGTASIRAKGYYYDLCGIRKYYSGSKTITVEAAPDVITQEYSLSITPTSMNINVGHSTDIIATLTTRTYTNGTLTNTTSGTVNDDCTWTSSSDTNATVSSGTVTGKQGKNDGTSTAVPVTITCRYTDPSGTTHTKTAIVNVSDVINYGYTYRLAISGGSTALDAGTATRWDATYYTTTITYKNGSVYSSSENSGSTVTSSASWTSSNSAVATVSAGVVAGVAGKYGTSLITASYNGYSASRSITVNYSDYEYSFSISPTSKTIDAGTSFTITPSLSRRLWTNGSAGSWSTITGSYSWTSSNNAVATVSSGTVTGVAGKYGTSTITCTENSYTGRSVTCSVTVNYSYSEYWISPNPINVSVITASAPTYVTASAYMRTYTNGVTGESINRSNKSTWSAVGAAAIFTPVTGAVIISNNTPVGTGVVFATDNDYGYSASAPYNAVWSGSTGGSTGTTTPKYSGVIGATISSTGPNVPSSISAWGYSYDYTPGNLGNTQAVPIYVAQNIINGSSFKPDYLSTPGVLATSGMYVTRWAPPSQSRKWSSVLSTPGYLWIIMGDDNNKVNNSYGQLLCLNISNSVINAADGLTSPTAVTFANCTKYFVV